MMNRLKRNTLYLYAESARIKIKDLANTLKKTPQRMKYALKVLENEGLVYDPYSIIDYSYFGLILFRVYFKGAYISEKDKLEIIQQLKENEYVVAIYEITGEFDLVIEIEAPNPSRFNKVIKNIINETPTLSHYKVILNLVTHLFPRVYLTKEEDLWAHVSPQIIIGGDRSVQTFNEKELAVMNNLFLNPKLRITKLAKQVDLNIKTTKTILKNLQKKNIIRGFKYLINMNKLDVHGFRLFLKLHNLTKEREQELINYLVQTKEIVQAHKTVGDWDLEVDIESLEQTRARQLTIELRERFKDLIETFNMMSIYQYYKKTYLPKYIFNKEQKEAP